MKKYLQISLIIFVLVLFQVSFFLPLLGAFLNPNLVLSFAFIFLLNDDLEGALYSGFLGGLLYDVLSASHLGSSSIVFVLILLISYYSIRQLTSIKSLFYLALFFGHLAFFIARVDSFTFNVLIIVSGILSTVISMLFSRVFSFFNNASSYTL